MDRREFLAGTTAIAVAAGTGGCETEENGDDLARNDGHDLAEMIKSGEISAREVTDRFIANIERLNGKINAVITPIFEQGRERADGDLGDGPFAGVPFLLKDIIDYEGVRITYGCKWFLNMNYVSDWTPPFVQSLEEAGLIVLGKTNAPEFGLISTTESLALGNCRNPWNLNYSVGGSSGGAAAAVAAGMVPLAQGSDRAGSIRLPASCCGVFTLKPSRGKMKRSTKDTPPGDLGTRHVISRSVRDSALAHAVAEQSGSSALLTPTGLIEAPSSKRLKIAFSTENHFDDEPDADVKAAIDSTAALCADLGHEIVEVSNPVDGAALTESIITVAASGLPEIIAAIEKQYGVAAEETGLVEPWTLGLVDYFNDKPADALSQSLAYFQEVTGLMEAWFEDYDVWLTPVCKSAPPELGVQGPEVPFDTLWERVLNYMSYTLVHNAAGIPAMSVPLSWNEAGLPIGSQFAAPLNGDGILLSLAFELEDARPWTDKWAPYSAVNR